MFSSFNHQFWVPLVSIVSLSSGPSLKAAFNLNNDRIQRLDFKTFAQEFSFFFLNCAHSPEHPGPSSFLSSFWTSFLTHFRPKQLVCDSFELNDRQKVQRKTVAVADRSTQQATTFTYTNNFNQRQQQQHKQQTTTDHGDNIVKQARQNVAACLHWTVFLIKLW